MHAWTSGAAELAHDAAEPLGLPVFPVIPYGVTPGFSTYPGTVSLRIETLCAVVRDVLDDPNDATITKTIVALAHSLGLDVIAEGVETEAQRDFLIRSGCKAYQGYLFSRPLPIDAFDGFARQS